jgi:dTDP-4-amino-4,6-dideoxygalactose transaminase
MFKILEAIHVDIIRYFNISPELIELAITEKIKVIQSGHLKQGK